ncbi:MAG: endopeptidase La [Elusimicrobiaceae bacterium]
MKINLTPKPKSETAPEKTPELPKFLPAVTIRDVVMFPGMALPLSVDREKSVNAIEAALKKDKYILALTQRDPENDDPQPDDIYRYGVVSTIAQSLKMPDGSIKVFLQGVTRAKALDVYFDETAHAWFAQVEYPEEKYETTPQTEALMRQALDAFEKYVKVSKRIGVEAVSFLRQITDASKLADTIASNIIIKSGDRQDLLEQPDPKLRLEKLLSILASEVEILSIEEKIHSEVRGKIEQSQKEYYLNEQLKAIQKELNQKDDFHKELDELRALIKQNKLSKEAAAIAVKELDRLDKMAPFSPESTVARTYLDWLLNMPWEVSTEDILDIKKARKVLDDDHFGLDKPKERILEYIAVTKLTKELHGPVLCFVGPPGVGKTSLAKSIARAIGRKFVRVSLGGVRDESEIRGHRRTYIGSLPGRVIQSISKVKSNNPVFLLDEIDKMGMDWRGDPSAALLEVLDPEQNKDFVDHYLDSPFDISKVMFITTANSLDGIPYSLRDRLEILEFSGYTHDEKQAIVRDYLIPKQLKLHGLKGAMLDINKAAVDRVVMEYTREAGVRNLEREIGNICRKAAREYVETSKNVKVTAQNLEKYLGIPKFSRDKLEVNAVGVSTGLAWTEFGGETLSIEAATFAGKGNVELTGQMGDVMKESANTALSYVRSKGLAKDFKFAENDIHLHIPEGAIPKDGPSAGIAMMTALASMFTKKAVKRSVAMTGEITLTGRVLAVGGVKEKLLAAFREKMKTVLIPKGNMKDLEDVPEKVRKELEIIPVTHADEVLEIMLGK